jgi:hypothetical protein
VEKHLIYVTLTESGEQISLAPADFSERYGWKNDLSKVRLLSKPDDGQQPEQAENPPGEADQPVPELES